MKREQKVLFAFLARSWTGLYRNDGVVSTRHIGVKFFRGLFFMLCLRTFGGLAVERDGKPLPPPGPRRRLLALLALIAGHEQPGISRDKLQAYLWPESDATHARNNLKQGLYSLRQTFRIPLINCLGGVLRFDPQLIDVDLWQFQAAMRRGDAISAVTAYRGPFLDGFYVSGLDEFERWMESERERLAQTYGDALRTLAERAEAKGDWVGALVWWRRLTAAEPLCSTAALGLMRTLAAAGDPTAARQHARIHAAYVRSELGGPVSEAVVALANRLRTDPVPGEPAPPLAQSGTVRAVVLAPRGPERRSGPVAVPAAGVISSPDVSPLGRVPGVAWLVTAAFWALTLLLIATHRAESMRIGEAARRTEQTTPPLPLHRLEADNR